VSHLQYQEKNKISLKTKMCGTIRSVRAPAACCAKLIAWRTSRMSRESACIRCSSAATRWASTSCRASTTWVCTRRPRASSYPVAFWASARSTIYQTPRRINTMKKTCNPGTFMSSSVTPCSADTMTTRRSDGNYWFYVSIQNRRRSLHNQAPRLAAAVSSVAHRADEGSRGRRGGPAAMRPTEFGRRIYARRPSFCICCPC